MRIKIKKIGTVPGGAEARLAENHIAGTIQLDGLSLPVEYEIEGELAEPIQVGKSVLVFRDRRNGVKCPGIFQSTAVQEVTPEGFRTRNSVYITSSCSENLAPEANKETPSISPNATTKLSSK